MLPRVDPLINRFVFPHAQTKFISYILLAAIVNFSLLYSHLVSGVGVLLLDDGRYILPCTRMRRIIPTWNLELGMPFISFFPLMERLISSRYNPFMYSACTRAQYTCHLPSPLVLLGLIFANLLASHCPCHSGCLVSRWGDNRHLVISNHPTMRTI